ncbi:MAG: hypothetical protein R3E86_05270 [Pseudomonadales bacterium]
MTEWNRRGALVLLLVGCAAGCDAPTSQTPSADSSAAAPPYQLVVDDKQLMDWIIDPTTDVIWGAAGSIITEEGEQALAPTTEEGWNAVRNAAAQLAESANLLMLPGRARDGGWVEISGGLREVALQALAAAEAHDEEALFQAGANIYNVCVACHQVYIFEPAGA